ncbi:UvrD/REP helicase [Mesorhizobium plurifarium]|uniref:DNA 3'-5' helicase n=1 Tax=Mesorhizobium plurifarium TaxID=69974 RepID=A0A090DFK4_MESPL|nr:UvrD/REP helicase [Mesorhizobium plurifarium]
MENFSLVRLAANQLRVDIDPGLAELDATAIIARAIANRELTLEELPAGDATLAGALGIFNRKYKLVVVQAGLDAATKLEVIAHEIGHEVVHQGEIATVQRSYGKPGPGDPVLRIEAYGVKERREAQANVFARELLLPRALARRLFLGGMRAHAIAAKTGLNLTLVFQQLTDALLLPEPVAPPAERPGAFKGLDPSQDFAANFRGKALLLEAGPGTGKTRTLVERIVRLIERGEAKPDEILALTFSNKAAGELADRVGKAVGSAAANIWTSTFHAFGLELLRKHHAMFGLSQDPRLVDGSQAIDLLEETLPALPIVHLQNLFEPAMALRDILKAISRAKDELVGWQAYADLADKMAQRAQGLDEDARIAAAKAQEVALVYRHYQQQLDRLKAVDYGDLVMLPALKLRDDEDFRKVLKQQFRWIHVDEYQDINRASAILIKGIARDGERLWVVGDARQSIYRFRGASTRNMARFGLDYPNHARAPLEVNYRSTKPVIDIFTEFSTKMKVSEYSLPLSLRSDRAGTAERPGILIAADPEDECSRLAASVRQLQSEGVALADQAVLARSNATLARIGEELEARGIPVQYIGPLFDRPEVRDLLSLLSFIAGSGSTLLRVATLADYQVGVGDLLKLFEAAQTAEVRAFEMLARLEDVEGLSTTGRAGLLRLAKHLDGFGYGNTPWLVLMEYLFERSDYVAGLLSGNTPSADMRRVAVRQLIEALRSMPLAGSRPPIIRGLARIRHMILLADDRELRRLPDEMTGVDGVNLLTVHASKGLEFEAIHLPGLTNRAVPAPNRPDRCPPPDRLVADDIETDAHMAEEQCLFFVAMSRAKSHLRLYRPTRSGSQTANPSTFLQGLDLDVLIADPIARSIAKPVFTRLPEPPAPPLNARDIEMYDRCPRRYYYDRVIGLPGDRLESTYLAAHRCLLKVIEAARRSAEPLSDETIQSLFDETWNESGLVDHFYEQPYRRLTESMLASLRPLLAQGLGGITPIVVKIGGFDIEVRPDQIAADGMATTLRSIRSGRPTTTEQDRLGNTLLLQAAANQYGMGGRVETFHLVGGQTTLIEQTVKKRENRLASSAAIAKAIQGGDYPPKMSDWECPRCRHFFTCPAPADNSA